MPLRSLILFNLGNKMQISLKGKYNSYETVPTSLRSYRETSQGLKWSWIHHTSSEDTVNVIAKEHTDCGTDPVLFVCFEVAVK